MAFYWGRFPFKTLTLFNSTSKTCSNTLLSCPVVLVILMLEDLLSIKPIFFSKPLMNGPIFSRWHKILTNTDTFFSWVPVRRSVTGILKFVAHFWFESVLQCSNFLHWCATIVRIFCTVINQGFPYNRREGDFQLQKLALYSQIGGKSETFW